MCRFHQCIALDSIGGDALGELFGAIVSHDERWQLRFFPVCRCQESNERRESSACRRQLLSSGANSIGKLHSFRFFSETADLTLAHAAINYI